MPPINQHTASPFLLPQSALPPSYRGMKQTMPLGELLSPNQMPVDGELKQNELLSGLLFTIDSQYGERLRQALEQFDESLAPKESEPSSPRSPSQPASWECTPAGRMVQVVRVMAYLLTALQTTRLAPELYIKLFEGVEPYLRMFKEAVRRLLQAINHPDIASMLDSTTLADLDSPLQVVGLNWYEVVQVIDRCLPRIYSMLVVGFEAIELGIGDPYELLHDMSLALKGCQHPVKTLVLHHYFIGCIRGLKRSLSSQKILLHLMDSFVEINKAWVRHQHCGLCSEHELRSQERILLQPIVASAVAALSHHCGVDTNGYSNFVLPTILEHVVASRDAMAQLYYTNLLLEVFPAELHLLTVDQLISAIAAFVESIDIQPVVLALITRLSAHMRRTNEEADSFLDCVDASDLDKVLSCFWSCLLALFVERREIQLNDVFTMTLFIVELSREFNRTEAGFVDKVCATLARHLGSLQSVLPDLIVDPAGIAFKQLVMETANGVGMLKLSGLGALLSWLAPRPRISLTLDILERFRGERIPLDTLVQLAKPVLDIPIGLAALDDGMAECLYSGLSSLAQYMLAAAKDGASLIELWSMLNVPTLHPLILPFVVPPVVLRLQPEQIKKVVGQFVHRLSLSPISFVLENCASDALYAVFTAEHVFCLAIEVLMQAAVRLADREEWAYEFVVEHLTVASKQLAAMSCIHANLHGLELSGNNFKAVADKLLQMAERQLKKADRARLLLRCLDLLTAAGLEDGCLSCLAKIDCAMGGMEHSEPDTRDELFVLLLDAAKRTVSLDAEAVAMPLAVQHFNQILLKFRPPEADSKLPMMQYRQLLSAYGLTLEQPSRKPEEAGDRPFAREIELPSADDHCTGETASKYPVFHGDLSDSDNPF